MSTSKDGDIALDIGHFESKMGNDLATLGRTGDVYIEGAIFAKIQCSLEVHPVSNMIMFFDQSQSQTCQIGGKSAMPFESDRPRRMVVISLTVLPIYPRV